MIDPSLPIDESADALAVDRRLTTGERGVQFARSILVPFHRLGTPRPAGFYSIPTGGVIQGQTMFVMVGPVTAPILRWGIEFSTLWGSGLTSVTWRIEATVTGLVPVVVASGVWAPTDPLPFVAGNINLLGVVGIGARAHTEEAIFAVQVAGAGGTGEPVAVRPYIPWWLTAN